jgi:hypothetical protein
MAQSRMNRRDRERLAAVWLHRGVRARSRTQPVTTPPSTPSRPSPQRDHRRPPTDRAAAPHSPRSPLRRRGPRRPQPSFPASGGLHTAGVLWADRPGSLRPTSRLAEDVPGVVEFRRRSGDGFSQGSVTPESGDGAARARRRGRAWRGRGSRCDLPELPLGFEHVGGGPARAHARATASASTLREVRGRSRSSARKSSSTATSAHKIQDLRK